MVGWYIDLGRASLVRADVSFPVLFLVCSVLSPKLAVWPQPSCEHYRRHGRLGGDRVQLKPVNGGRKVRRVAIRIISSDSAKTIIREIAIIGIPP